MSTSVVEYETLSVSHEQYVVHVTLNRPEVLNSINDQMIEDLHAVLDDAEERKVRIVTLTGAGRAFCAGADLSAFGTEPGATIPFLVRLQAFVVRLTQISIPVISVVNGAAMGGGLELILASDFSIAADTAKVGDGHTNVGVIPGAGGATLLQQRVPQQIAKYVVFTGGRLTADEWKTYGLFAEVVKPSELIERRDELAMNLAAKSPLSLQAIKRLMADSRQISQPATALAMELAENEQYSRSRDMAEGIAAFNEKRQPVFVGM